MASREPCLVVLRRRIVGLADELHDRPELASRGGEGSAGVPRRAGRLASRGGDGGGGERARAAARRDPLRDRAARGGVVVGATGLPPDGAVVSLRIDVYGRNGLKRGAPIFNAWFRLGGSIVLRLRYQGPPPLSGNVPRYQVEIFWWDGCWVPYTPTSNPWELTVQALRRGSSSSTSGTASRTRCGSRHRSTTSRRPCVAGQMQHGSTTRACDLQRYVARFCWRHVSPMTRVLRAVSTTSLVITERSLIFIMPFDLGEQSVDEAEVAAGDAADGGDGLGVGEVGEVQAPIDAAARESSPGGSCGTTPRENLIGCAVPVAGLATHGSEAARSLAAMTQIPGGSAASPWDAHRAHRRMGPHVVTAVPRHPTRLVHPPRVSMLLTNSPGVAVGGASQRVA